MKPAPFDYICPTSLDDALETLHALTEDGVDVKLMAGGQSLIPLMNMRLATPAAVIDLNVLEDELQYIRPAGDALVMGGLTRHVQLEESSLIAEACPLIAEAEGLIGHPQIRSRGTLGGSLVHADPAAELPLVMTLLEATLRLRSQRGERQMAPAEFFLTYLTTAILPDEILTEITVPVLPPRTGQAIAEFSLRHGDFAIVAVAAQVELDDDDQLLSGRLAIGGAASIPVDASEVFTGIRGRVVTDALIRDALRDLGSRLDPADDLHASASYRVDLAETLAFRATKTALGRAYARSKRGYRRESRVRHRER